MRRGTLRVYLGSAPGVGKTFAMLDEGHRRRGRGTDVVVGLVETHGRPRTAAAVEGLEVLPRKEIRYRGAGFEELDVDALLARAPEVALVDELAHTNVPGSARAKRWQDVELLLEAGIDVVTTVNAQHLESLNDVVLEITGVPQRETVPDAVVRAAEQVQLVDMTPEALRRRMAHGNIYAAGKVDAALSNFFRVGNLTALRELALLWLADSVEEGLQRYREQHGIGTGWETRERVVVALTGGPEGETLIRRAARIAARASGGELVAVHIARSDGLAGASVAALQQQRVLVESLGGRYHESVGDDVPAALLEVARGLSASQLVVGASRRRRTFTAGTTASVIRQAGAVDVHVVTHEYAGAGRVLPQLPRGLTVRRRLAGLLVAAVLLCLLTPFLAAVDKTLVTDVQVYLAAVVAVALVGGMLPALVTAVAASLVLNWFFVPPVHTFTIGTSQNALALLIFLLVGAAVSLVVELSARRSSQAARSSAEAETLSTLAGSVLRGESALPALLERVRETFAVSSVALVRRPAEAPTSAGGPGEPEVVASVGGAFGSTAPAGPGDAGADAGRPPSARPAAQGVTEVPVRGDLVLLLHGRVLPAEDRRVLAAFAATVGVAYEQRRLAEEVERTAPIREADRVRSALLAAVSHDLRTPLASVKAAVGALRADDVPLDRETERELLAGAEEDVDRLTALVGDLLDLSRLEAGVLSVFAEPVAVEEVVGRALDHAADGVPVRVELPDTLPFACCDPVLLERVLANLVQNALRYAPGAPPLVNASVHGDRVEVRVVDTGPGIPATQRDRMFTAFQRLGDASNADGPGVGLGLAVARGFTEAMGGTLTPDDTPGGGLTMVVSLPAEPQRSGRGDHDAARP